MLEVTNVGVTYGTGPTKVEAIRELSFSVGAGEFVSIVGPSGCGKTTLLKCLSGLMRPTSGEARLNGSTIAGPPADLALVFQEYTRSLMPWLSVKGNILLPLKSKGLPKAEMQGRAQEAVNAVGLPDVLDRYPWQLSGGMQQRVAIARALAYQPKVMLMDEPFASVDAQTRSDLEDLMLKVQRDLGLTVVFVTHDVDEAVYLGDRVVVLGRPPTSVREAVDVSLPRPRDQIATKELREFSHLRTEILRLIKRGPDEQGGSGPVAQPTAGTIEKVS